jgi:hypothetical protein
MGAAHGEVAERDAQRERPQAHVERGAERALVVAVHDHERGVVWAADVVFFRDGWDGR